MKPTTPSPISRNACSPSTRFGALHLATMLVAVFSLSAQAGVDYWDGTGNLWGTASFWSTASGATTPDPVTAPVAGDQAVFNTTILNTSQTVYLGGNQSVSNLVFNSTGATTLLGGSSGSPAANTLTLGSNTNSIAAITSGASAGNVIIGDTTGGGANVTAGLFGSTNYTFVIPTGRTLILANGFNFGTSKIQNTGAGTVVLNGAGTGAGLTTVVGGVTYSIIARLDAGVVTLGNPQAFGTGVIDTRSYTLQANTDLTGANKIANTFVIPTGTTTIGGSTNIELGGQFICNATGGLTINNTASTFLSGNLYLSDAAATAHTLTVGGAAGNLTISGLIANYTGGAGVAGALTKTGAGLLIISSANNTYSGNTTIGASGGAAVLRVAGTQALGSGQINFDGTGNASTARLELTNGVSLNNAISMAARANTTVAIENMGGTNTLSGAITLIAGGSDYHIQSDTNFLTLGTALATVISAGSGARNVTLQGNADGQIVGNIANGAGTVAITKAGTGTWTLSGSNTFTFGSTNTGGTIVMASTNALGTNALSFSGTVNAVLDIATDGSDTTNNILASSSTVWTIASDVKTGSTGINHTLGTFNIGSGGTPLQANFTRGPNVTGGNPRITATSMLLSGGSGGTTIVNPTTAALSIGPVTASVTSKTLQLDGTNTANTITGIISDGGGNIISLVKTNSSTWNLSGANSYSGSTTVAQGTLALSGSGSIASANLTLASGAVLDVSASSYTLGAAQTLIGAGTINGNFGDNSGAQIVPAGSNAVGVLTFNNNLNLSGGDTIKYDFAIGTNDSLAVGGNLSPAGTTTINLASLPGGAYLAAGDYVLIRVTGTLNGSAGNFTITGVPSPSRQSFSVLYDTASSPKRVLLHVTGSNGSLVWQGGVNGNVWDSTTTNWLNGGLGDLFFNGDNTSFTSAGAANPPVLNQTVFPSQVNFTSGSYTLSGTGKVSGGSTLSQSGGGTLTISTTNDYTGVTTIGSGTVSVALLANGGTASALGAAASASANIVFDSGTLQYTGDTVSTDHGATLNAAGGTVQVSTAATALSVGGVIAGTSSGGLTKTGNGTLVLSGANTYNGNTTVSAGVLQVGNGGATGNLGSGSTITDNSAIVALRTGTLTITNTIVGSGSITNNGTGTLVLGGNNTYIGSTTVNTGIVQVVSSTGLGATPASFDPAHISVGIGELEFSANVSLADTNSGVTVTAGTIGVDTNFTVIISNQVTSAISLNKSRPGTLILSGSNAISGLLNVDTSSTTGSDGILRITSTNAIAGVTTIQIRNNQGPGSSTLQLDGTTGGIEYDQALVWNGRNNPVPGIESFAGNNSLNPASSTLNVGGTFYTIQSDAGGSLTMPGTFPSSAPIATRNLMFAGDGRIDITGSIVSAGCTNLILLKTNNGVLTLWTGNSYSGNTSVQGGTLNAADNSSFGTSTANIELGPLAGENGTLNISNASVTAQRIIVAGATANNTAPGTGTINQFSGTVNASQWVTVGSGGTTGGTGTYNLSGGSLNVQNTAGGTQLEVANFTGSSGTLNISGTAALNIDNNAFISLGANPNAANGTVNQNGGTVTFYSDGGGTVGGTGILYLGKATGLTSNYVYNLNGGTLTVPTIATSSGNSYFYLNGGTLAAARSNANFMSGLTAAFVSVRSSTIDSGSSAITIAQPLLHDPVLSILPDGGLTNISSSGSGTLTLTAANTYTGPTVIQSGTLNISGSISTGPVSINGGVLGGVGVVNGPTTLVTGTNAPGGSGVIGTLTISNSFTMQGGTVQFDMNKSSNDVLAVTGAVSASAPTTLLLAFPSPNVGTYTLITYGSLAGFGNLSIGLTAPNPRFTFTLQNDTVNKAVKLVVTGNSANLTWKGDGGFNGWDNTGTYQNWLKSATPDFFYDGDVVTFDNTGNAAAPINLQGTLSPGSVTVNSSQNYDFANSGGSISGTGGLIKNGSGTLTIEENNTYSGLTLISGGVIQVGNGSSSGSLGSGVITNNASLVLDRGDATTMPSPIYGSGSVTMAGGGTVGASGSNYYTGTTTINTGVTFLQNPNGLGATNGTVSVASGAQLYVTANVDNGGNPLSLIGTGDSNGALRKGGAGATTYNGAVSLTGDTSISVDGGATLNMPSGINGAAANANLTLFGGGAGALTGPLALGSGGLTVTAGTWTLGTNNTFTGLTALNGGTTRIKDGTLGNPASFTANQITFGGGALEAITNATFNDGKAGLTLNANTTLIVDTNATLTISNAITGGNALTKSGPGTLVLNGSNPFTGTLNLDTTSTTANDGAVRITTSNAILNVTSPINSHDNNGGSSIFQLDGSAGAIAIPQDFGVSCRNSGVPWIENVAGNNTLLGTLNINSGGGALLFQSDVGQLELAGPLTYIGALTGGRTYTFTGTGNHLVSGVISSAGNGAPIGVAMNGTGRLILSAVNTYTNTTTVTSGTLLVNGSINSSAGVSVTGGTLGGIGAINDTVSIGASGTFSPGAQAIGTITISSNLTLAGTTYIEVSKTGNTNDNIVGLPNVNYGGTLFATNLAGTLNIGDSFTVFNTAAHTGNFASVTGTPGAGKGWSFNPSTGVLSVVVGVNSTPTNIVTSVSGNTLTLSWPADHIGWRLQAQTNSLGIGLKPATNAWFDVAGSTSVNSVNVTFNPANGTVFYRMVYP